MVKTMGETKKFYTVQDVADLLRVKKKTVLSWIKNGTIPATKINKKMYLIYEDQFSQFLKKNQFI